MENTLLVMGQGGINQVSYFFNNSNNDDQGKDIVNVLETRIQLLGNLKYKVKIEQNKGKVLNILQNKKFF